MKSGFVSIIMVVLLAQLVIFSFSGCSSQPDDSAAAGGNLDNNNNISSATSDYSDQNNPGNGYNRPGQDENNNQITDTNNIENNDKSSKDMDSNTTDDITGMAKWPFIPASARIHPLSHFIPTDKENRAVIYMRVEFFDRYEHNTKGMGLIRFELYPLIDAESGFSINQRLEVWVDDINDLARNLERYDDVTRTYLFPIKVKMETMQLERGIIVMTIITPDKQFTDQMEIKFR